MTHFLKVDLYMTNFDHCHEIEGPLAPQILLFGCKPEKLQ